MKNTFLTGILLTVLGFAFWHSWRSDDFKSEEAEPALAPELIDDTEQQLAAMSANASETKFNDTSSEDDPKGEGEQKAYYEQLNFRQYFSEQLNQFKHDAEAAKQERKVALFAKISELEKATYFTANQGLFLKLAVLGKALSGEELDIAAEQLKADYQSQSEAILAAHAANSDPLLAEYKQREREIVKEVLALSEYPEGQTQEQYLQQRLEAARKAIYSQR